MFIIFHNSPIIFLIKIIQEKNWTDQNLALLFVIRKILARVSTQQQQVAAWILLVQDLQQLLFHSVVETTPSYLSETSTLVRASKLGSTQLLPNRCTYPPSFFGSCSTTRVYSASIPAKLKGVLFELLHYKEQCQGGAFMGEIGSLIRNNQ